MDRTIQRVFHIALFLSMAALLGSASAKDIAGGSFSGEAVIGAIANSGEKSWLDGGLGKLRRGDDQAGVTIDAIVSLRTQFTGRVGAVISGEIGDDANPSIGLGEAYLKLRPELGADWRFSGRAGIFFPPFSLEHDGTEWSVVRTLTPSAINSWLAEEVKTVGLEATLRGDLLGQRIGLTLAGFQANDTSGTLLAFRGWALHDQRAPVGGRLQLPSVSPMFSGTQAAGTQPVDEIDDRWGGYAKLDIEPSDLFKLSLSLYDNNGDETSLDEGQYAWRTRFLQASGSWSPDYDTEILVQLMNGETRMGPLMNNQSPADIGFLSVFALASKDLQHGTASGRIEYFAISDRSFKAIDNNSERGWSATVAWIQRLSPRKSLVFEGVFVESNRQDRERFGLDHSQQSVQGRIALRIAL